MWDLCVLPGPVTKAITNMLESMGASVPTGYCRLLPRGRAMRYHSSLIAISVCSLAAASYIETRKAAAATLIEAYDKAKYEIVNDRFLLITLKIPVSGTQLIDAAKKSGARISAVYWCVKGGGVLSLYLDPRQSLADQLQKAQGKGDDSAERQIKSFGNAASLPGYTVDGGTDFQAYCGFEAQGAWTALKALRASLEPSIYMLEISTARVRLMPANLVH